jgi:beta-lactamase class A
MFPRKKEQKPFSRVCLFKKLDICPVYINIKYMDYNTIRSGKAPLFIAIIFALGAAFFLGYKLSPKNQTDLSETKCNSQYTFLNDSIACDFNEEENLETIKNLESQISALADSAAKEKSADSVSVFFRDLKSIKFFGVNENKEYAPASLLKLPIAIAYYKYSEIDPSILTKKYVYKAEDHLDMPQYFPPSAELEVGKEYTMEEIIEQMLVYSDNDAVDILASNIDKNFLIKVYDDLGIVSINEDFFSSKDYAAVLRILYNSSYMTRKNSQKILDLLTKSVFTEGLVAGVPSSVAVANKFGERTTETGEKELHDCGIIYYPDNPYILCVMTLGKNFDQLAEIIKKVSYLVYQEMNKK